MTIKSYTAGSLSLSEIQTEFGGSNPIDLSEYYAGGTYVNSGTLGYPNGSAIAIPSSGAISISNFYGASAEPNAVTLANYFWTNRSSLVRYGNTRGINYYPGDSFSNNDYNARYVPSFTNAFSYSNSGLAVTSAFYTVISVTTGAIGNYGGITSAVAGPGTLISDPAVVTLIGDGAQPSLVGNGYGVSVKLRVYQGQIKDVTSTSLTSNHIGGNQGAWGYSYMIPGKWGFSSASINFNPGTYAPTLGPGDMHLMVVERGGNYGNMMPVPTGVSNVMTTDNWWYNGGGAQLAVNTTSSSASVSWPAQAYPEYDSYGNFTGNYTYSSYFDGMTPRVGGVLTRFY